MKLLIPLFSVILILCFKYPENSKQINPETNISQNLFCPDPPSFSETVKTVSAKNVNDETDQDWYSKAIEQIEKEEYNISYNEDLGAFQSPNRANNIRFIYHKDGFTALPRDAIGQTSDVRRQTLDEWSIKFKVESSKLIIQNKKTDLSSPRVPGGDPFINSQNNSSFLKDASLQVAGNKATIEDENIRIDYTNDKDGMRQDFIIKRKPEGEGKLRVNISADTKLKMIVGADALMFKDKYGINKMKYSSLKCWDANGLELRAYFEKSSQLQISNDKLQIKNKSHEHYDKNICNLKSVPPAADGNSFSILVNDENATYPITIDPLSTSPDWTAESNQPGAQFGVSVSTAGDVNGDGYSDVIVGAFLYDNGQTNEGASFVYHGSATGLSPSADWMAEGDLGGAQFGISVSTAGDINGDGYSDVIVGARFYNNGQANEGKVFVYQGSASGLSDSADWTKESNQTGAEFGISVSTAGDVNSDGYSDVIIGAQHFDNGQTNEGRAFVYHGSASGLSATSNWTAESDQANASFGNCVSTAGDVNGDGYSDVIVGAYRYDNGQTDEGRAYVYHGSASGLSGSTQWAAESNQSGAEFGNSVSTAGDVNGDGYSDVIVGAYLFDNGQTDEGKVFVYGGSTFGLSASALWTEESDLAGSWFGFSVSTAGDVNGDGYSDVIVSAPYYDNGAVFVYNAGSTSWSVISNQYGSEFGFSVSTAGDVNGDGYSDVIVGARYYNNGQTDEGRAFVYHGSAAGLSASANWTEEGEQSGSEFGFSVSSAGDINGDGYSDVIVGAPSYDTGPPPGYQGKVYVYHGSATGLSVSANWTAESNVSGAKFGISVSTAGDVNGDGYSDVIAGADYSLDGNGGRVFVYHGSASGLSDSADWTKGSNQVWSQFGYSVSTAGDVNGDGYSDVIVGAPEYDVAYEDEGRVFVYYGSASGLSSTANWTKESSQTGAEFGYSVSTAGDVNGDGYSDVIVGSRYYNNGQSYEGRAFVYHGSSSGLSASANWTAESDQANAEFGSSVSTAGDVNGDGYSDVIVGASYFDNGQADEGRAFVYHGSASGLSVLANWTAESDQTSAHFGFSVSTAGDINGDGYSDVIVGAPYFQNVNNDGKAYVYHGSASGLSVTENWSESNLIYSELGYCLSAAGDVNGDGYSDVIVSSHFGSNTQGSAHIFYGNEGPGLRSTVRQFKPGTSNIIYSGGLSGTNGQARLNIFAKSPFGRAYGKMIYEYKENGVPFSSGNNITNSIQSSGSGTISDLGISGVQLNKDISGLNPDKEYKWRARLQFSLVNNPYQKFGPWKYYNNYVPTPLGNFRAWDGNPLPTTQQLNLNLFIQGFYDPGSDDMVGDTVTVYLRDNSSPYAVVDSAKAFVNSAGQGTFTFSNAVNSILYYIEAVHRNSIKTWSKTAQQFTASALSYDFTSANTQAYGDNMADIDASPVRYGIFSGDENQNGVVDLTDVVNISNAASSFTVGYVPTDMNGDNVTDLSDLVITSNNASAFVAAIVP